MSADRNAFPAKCFRCDKLVPKGEGAVMGQPGKWIVTHLSCIPELRPWIKKLEYDL
jgi:hypothetical protein